MTAPEDAAIYVVNAFVGAMKAAFNPDDAIQPPLGGGSTVVRFVAGEVLPLQMWDAHAIGIGCNEPLLWVRLASQYRSKNFPEPTVDIEACPLPRVVRIEVGVGRCSTIPENGIADWKAIAREAEISLDDRWRLDLALCAAKGFLPNNAFATDSIVPSGPEGGVTAWAGLARVQL